MGRKPKGKRAMTNAERQQAYREREQAKAAEAGKGPGARGQLGRGYAARNGYGNSSAYRVARIARDAPEVLEKMKQGEYNSVRDGERAAGLYPPKLSPEARRVDNLLRAWDRATHAEREEFLAMLIVCGDIVSEGLEIVDKGAESEQSP